MRGSGITHELVNPRTSGMPMTSSTAADKLLPQRGGSLAHILQKFFFLQLLTQRGGSLAHILKKFFLSFYRDCARRFAMLLTFQNVCQETKKK
jgi:hypothetical protein